MSDALNRITALAQVLLKAEAKVTSLTEELRLAKETARGLSEEDLPELMRELEITEIRLEDGTSVKVSDEVSCAITEFNKPAAHEWLTLHGYGGLIKTAVEVMFGRDEHDAAMAAAKEIEGQLSREVMVSESVHPQTLKAFVKERLEAGETIPSDLFSLRPYAKAKLTMPKVKKAKT